MCPDSINAPNRGRTSHAVCALLLSCLTLPATAGNLTVGPGSSLSGRGVVNADVRVTNGGRINPGAGGIGCLIVTSLDLEPGSVVETTVAGPAPCGQHDSIFVSGQLAINQSSLTVPTSGAYTPVFNDELVLLSAGDLGAGSRTFFVNGAPGETVAVGGIAMSIESNGGDGNDISLVYRRRPSDPLILSAEVLNESEIEVQYEVENPGASPIDAITVQCEGGGQTISAAGNAGSATVSGLSDEVSYLCTVFAANADGTSQSLATLPLTPEALANGLPIWLIYEATR